MRYSGYIGIQDQPIETSPGMFKFQIREVRVNGDLYTKRTSWPNAQMSGASLGMTFSMVTPESDDINFTDVLYFVYQNRKWAVTSIEYDRPRVKLNLGGLYNG